VVRALVIIAFLAAWFLPLIIAALYKLPHQGPIAVLSLLLGWTGVGWLAALVISVGGAIRATRPAFGGQEQPQAPGSAPSYAPAQAPWPSSSAVAAPSPAGAPFPAGAQQPERAQAPEQAQAPERPPSPWPDGPR